MIVRSSWRFAAPPARVWPLLTNSRLEPRRSCLFGLGLPRPEECRLPGGAGGVGATRRCVSDRGVVEQTILVWEPPARLSFRMDRTDLSFRRFVREIVETFDLAPDGRGGTRATRTTRVEVTGRLRFLASALLFLGLKAIHRYVFRGWSRAAAAPARSDR